MKIDRFTFVAATKAATVNGERHVVNLENVEPANLRAIQWYGMVESPWGEVEYDGEPNQQFFDEGLILPIYNLWLEAKEKSDAEAEVNRIAQEERDGQYDSLRLRAYPDVTEQIGTIIKLLGKLVEDKKIDSIPEFDELVSQINEIKIKYPKPNTEIPLKTKKKKSK